MSDFGNILGYFDSAEHYYKNRKYVQAAEHYWKCHQYYQHGELPWYIEDVDVKGNLAEDKYRYVIENHFDKISLSKTTYIRGLQCAKSLWLNKHKYKEKVISGKLQKKFDHGNDIGRLALELFPNGQNATTMDCNNDMEQRLQTKSPLRVRSLPFVIKQVLWLEKTKTLIENDEQYIYEAAFTYNNVFSAVDILEKKGDKYIAYEVKASKEIKDVFINDCSLQYYVLSRNVPIEDFVLVYLNEDYLQEVSDESGKIRIDNCDINKLFIKKSIFESITELQSKVDENVKSLIKIVNQKSEPIIEMGNHCNNPYECDFFDYCSR